jgi:hypothetical protein
MFPVDFFLIGVNNMAIHIKFTDVLVVGSKVLRANRSHCGPWCTSAWIPS